MKNKDLVKMVAQNVRVKMGIKPTEKLRYKNNKASFTSEISGHKYRITIKKEKSEAERDLVNIEKHEPQPNMNELFDVGDMISGKCDGVFGKKDIHTKICVMVTKKYAVFQYTESIYDFATILNLTKKITMAQVENWKQDRHV